MSRKKSTQTRARRLASRFVPAPGSPFSEEDVAVIGVELLRIAERNKVGDVRSLDKRLVLAAVEADEDHPLRRFFEWDDAKAARSFRLVQAATMIRSVRVLSSGVGAREKPMPLFLFDPDHTRRVPGEAARRSRVVSEDLLRDDPAFVSNVAHTVRQITHMLERLEHVTSLRKGVPEQVLRYRDALRAATDDYLGELASAAEE